VRFAGDGAVLYRDLLARSDGTGELFGHPLLAGTIGRMALERAAAGEATDPAALRPLYVRRPDAELYREQAALHGRKGS
jgi:hypothetical protein